MSKGLGHVGRAIAAAFDAEPDNAFTTDELCQRVYKSEWATERSKRVAVLRAVKSLAVHRPDLDVTSTRKAYERGQEAVFYRRDRVLSYAMAQLKNYAGPRGATDDELRALLAPGGREHHLTQPGGSWLRHTEMAIAERDKAKTPDDLTKALDPRFRVIKPSGKGFMFSMYKPHEPSPPLTPEREAARRLLNDEERRMLGAMERELGRPLTEQEERLALEQARSLGMA